MIKVIPNGPNSLHIQWADLKGESFELSRSSAPDSGYEIIATDLLTPFYQDTNVNLSDNGRRYFYEVKGYTGGVEVDKSSGGVAQYSKPDGIANVVIHESQVVLKVMNNPKVQILLKRREGKRCPNCWNPITKKVRFTDCPVCNGTGIIGGYHLPIVTRISRDFSQLADNTSMLDGEKVDKSPVQAWITNTPLVSPGDVIADIMNQRFLIERVVQRTKSQHIIRQIIDMIPLEKGHPSYNVELDWSAFE